MASFDGPVLGCLLYLLLGATLTVCFVRAAGAVLASRCSSPSCCSRVCGAGCGGASGVGPSGALCCTKLAVRISASVFMYGEAVVPGAPESICLLPALCRCRAVPCRALLRALSPHSHTLWSTSGVLKKNAVSPSSNNLRFWWARCFPQVAVHLCCALPGGFVGGVLVCLMVWCSWRANKGSEYGRKNKSKNACGGGECG